MIKVAVMGLLLILAACGAPNAPSNDAASNDQVFVLSESQRQHVESGCGKQMNSNNLTVVGGGGLCAACHTVHSSDMKLLKPDWKAVCNF